MADWMEDFLDAPAAKETWADDFLGPPPEVTTPAISPTEFGEKVERADVEATLNALDAVGRTGARIGTTLAGAKVGATLGAPLGLPGVAFGGLIGAGAGAFGADLGLQSMDRLLYDKPIDAGQAAKEGVVGVVTQALGGPLGKLLAKGAGGAVRDLAFRTAPGAFRATQAATGFGAKALDSTAAKILSALSGAQTGMSIGGLQGAAMGVGAADASRRGLIKMLEAAGTYAGAKGQGATINALTRMAQTTETLTPELVKSVVNVVMRTVGPEAALESAQAAAKALPRDASPSFYKTRF